VEIRVSDFFESALNPWCLSISYIRLVKSERLHLK
jgi:hypothetical protein